MIRINMLCITEIRVYVLKIKLQNLTLSPLTADEFIKMNIIKSKIEK